MTIEDNAPDPRHPDRWGRRARNSDMIPADKRPLDLSTEQSSSLMRRLGDELLPYTAPAPQPPPPAPAPQIEEEQEPEDEDEDEEEIDDLYGTAHRIYNLRFHDLMTMSTETVAENPEKLKCEPYDLAACLSAWAIKELAKVKAE